VPSYRADLIERLALHGVAFETLTEDRTVEVEMIRLIDPRLADRANEGHVQVSVEQVATERRPWTFPKGSARVPTDQPLGDLVVLFLEPQSSESVYAIAPLAEAMLANDPALKAAFEAKLAAEPAFAADADARLAWFYERTPFYDDHYLLYPIAREVAL
jgi:hypothetical protein